MFEEFSRYRAELGEELSTIDYTGPDEAELRADLEKIESADGKSYLARRAAMLAYLLEHAPTGVNPHNPFVFRLQFYGLLWDLQNRRKAAMTGTLPPDEQRDIQVWGANGVFVSMLDTSHTSPDWESLATLGVSGLRDRAQNALARESDLGKRDFYAAVVLVYSAMGKALKRLAAAAAGAGMTFSAERLTHLAGNPPETLYDALLLGLFYDRIQDDDGVPVRSQGMFDRLYYPFYQADLAAGRMTEEDARNLLRGYWLMLYAVKHPNGKNICFGGLKGPGLDACNELTRMAFEVHYEMNLVSPKLTLRVHPDMDHETLLLAARCVRDGRNAIVFSNDVTSFEMFRRCGKEEPDIYNYVLIGCYEPAVQGREMCCSMAAWGSIAKPVEAAFNGGRTFDGIALAPSAPVPQNYAEFEAEYFRILDSMLEAVFARCCDFEKLWPETNPSPLISGTMADCIRSGRDVSQAGTRYNPSGVMCAGFANVVDSLLAVRYLVDEKKLCMVAELAEVLKNDWAGHEDWRLMVRNRVPKWGSGAPAADELGKKIFAHLADRINHAPNAKGGFFQLGLWSIDHNFTFGKKTAATPDGRHAGDALARNSGAGTGLAKNGVTGLMRSLMQLDLADSPDGSVLDVMLHPRNVAGPCGPEVIAQLIRTYYAGGGLHLHFNVQSPEDLRAAQEHPEEHKDMQIRVCGWNSRFVTLSREEQDAFILQSEQS